MLANERQQQIMARLLAQESASVAELSEAFGVSSVTIRNDLNQLADQGRVMRIHGGARIANGRTRQEYSFATRQGINAIRKERIGKVAATLINPMDSILLDASTTAAAVAQALKQTPILSEVTVVTTGLWTALELLEVPNVSTILAGGYVRSTTGSVTGSIATQVLQSLNIQKAFLGAWGLNLEEGLTDTHLLEVGLKKAVIERAQQVIAIVDGSKFGRLGLASFAAIDQISCLITDDSAPEEMLCALRRAGVDVYVAKDEQQ
ncbi:MAG: DeoR/GlpR transcriptional regulator [Caldilineaceae bacterium]|nr:DeoR/GlpR transcriptional regulator [Caldilineaceae bacterium]